MSYHFYGNNTPSIHPVNDEYCFIKDQNDILSHVWCAYTCAPRMRKDWNENNKTLGQCSITAFLAQDIFGGEVYGVPLEDGNYHCFNKIGDVVFDLTSEQFGNQKLDYQNVTKQTRESHFQKEEKYQRYLYLKEQIKKFQN